MAAPPRRVAAHRRRQGIRAVPHAPGVRARQDRLLDRAAAQRHQRQAVRLRVRPVVVRRHVMAEQRFNACVYLVDRRVDAGDGARLALIGADRQVTYAQLLDRVQRTARVLGDLGLQPEQRIAMFMADGPDFVAVFLAAMRIGAVPVPMSTMMNADGLAELLRDSRARLLAVTPEFAVAATRAAAGAPELRGVLIGGGSSGSAAGHDLDGLVAAAVPDGTVYPTTADSPAFWLYTSGTTGTAKAA